jgi:poly-gamma-glutamate synthesis protein (capsule biosynthesis protein)
MLDTLTLGQKVDSVRERADLVVALVHWGEEYHRVPSHRQKTMAKWMRSRGVDVVVGSHPHVIQPFEVERNEEGRTVGAVFYSLGNFISNQNDRNTDVGLAVRIGLHRKSAVGPIDLTIEADTIHRVRYTEGSKTHYELKIEN